MLDPASPIKNCQIPENAAIILWLTSISLSSFLLFLRLRAVFYHSKIIPPLFFLLWLAVVGTNYPILLQAEHVGPTQHCITTAIKRTDVVGGSFLALYDTLSFIMISIQLGRNSRNESNVVGRARTFVFGDGLPPLSKMLLKDGQSYFW